jgi:8-oxo-dGTP diphosphatase
MTGTSPDTTKPARHTIRAAVYLILRRDSNEVLLSRRANTGWQDGNYSLVSGHIDGNESFSQAMQREAKEEAGIGIELSDLQLAHAMHRFDIDGAEYIDMFFVADTWHGEVTNMEPDKCDELAWYSLDALPTNIILSVKLALEAYGRGQHYSEFGWTQP